VVLPSKLTCICLNEHDLGAFAQDLSCHLCRNHCDDLESLNKHIAEIHKISQVLIGENIKFERPEPDPSMICLSDAYYCPMVKCKYHIAESDQSKYFKAFKLLKQHYVKVHASKTHHCPNCDQKFGSATYLELHKKTCGQVFTCQCGANFSSLESLQTHSRRKAHQIDRKYLKSKTSSDPLFIDKLAILQGRSKQASNIPIAPKPSTMHINAAIALSELGVSGHQFTPKADIGIQTEHQEMVKSRKSTTPEAGWSLSKSRKGWGKVSAETQTKTGTGNKRRCPTVSSLVQTTGEFLVKSKRSRLEPELLASQGSQCRMSPAKKVIEEERRTVTTMTSTVSGLDTPGLNFSLSVDIPDFEDLWPLRINTNGTQTSPRVATFSRRFSVDSVDSLPLPELEKIDDMADTPKAPPLSEIRQFSTETQTELDILLDSADWSQGVTPMSPLQDGFLDMDKLLTTEMETQTHEEENLLLCANNCTQTWPEDILIKQLFGHNAPSMVNNGCSAETQTCLTGFQSQITGLGVGQSVVGLSETILSHIETQTVDMKDLLGL